MVLFFGGIIFALFGVLGCVDFSTKEKEMYRGNNSNSNRNI